MTAYIALIRREFLEHRGAFLYAPMAVIAVSSLVLITGLVFGEKHVFVTPNGVPGAHQIYNLVLTIIFAAWTAYLMVALFFYYADSFSADRRNNALLFWKSMPQSDLRILSSKALAGITIFPALIIAFAFITGVLAYILGLYISTRLPFLAAPGPVDAVTSWVQMGGVGIVYIAVTVLWYAPFLAWVAGLSTLFQRWSIPLAFLIPGLVVLLESILGTGNSNATHPIRDYLAYRSGGVGDDMGDKVFEQMIMNDQWGPGFLLQRLLGSTDWLQLVVGLIFTAAIVYIASEFRRRRIEA